jgi:hypothetical protein
LGSAVSRVCDYCTFSMPISADRCPHCARPSLFPNVDAASDPGEVAALDVRYTSAIATVTANGTAPIAALLEDDTATRSRVVISRDSNEVYRLACGDNQLYATFYNLVEAGFRVPADSKWDAIRPQIDAKMFPYYHAHIRFGALTLDDKGLRHYGDSHLILKSDMIDYRTTACTENTAAFIERNGSVPPGHRATWPGRGRLAVAKLASVLTSSTNDSDFPALLKADGETPDDDVFIEAHVYGSISIRTVEKVSLTRTKMRSVKLSVLRDKLNKMSVPLVSL